MMIRNFGKIGHNFLVYDGVNLSDHFVVKSFDMPLLPTITERTIEIDGKPGAWYAGRQIGTRDIHIGLGVLMDSRARKDAVKTWIDLSDKLAKDKVCKLEIGNGYYVNALLVGDTETDYNGKWSTVETVFRCFDPYIYGPTHTEALKTGNNALKIKGKFATYPVITVTTSSALTVKYNETNDQIRIPKNPTTSPLVIDMERHVVTSGSNYAAIDPTVSDFWPINPGTATINLNTGSGTLEYREVYL